MYLMRDLYPGNKYKELLQLANKKMHNPNKKRAKDVPGRFSGEDTRMANTHTKIRTASLVVTEMQTRSTVTCPFIPTRMDTMTKTVNNEC